MSKKKRQVHEDHQFCRDKGFKRNCQAYSSGGKGSPGVVFELWDDLVRKQLVRKKGMWTATGYRRGLTHGSITYTTPEYPTPAPAFAHATICNWGQA